VALDPVLLSAIASPRRREILRLLWNEELTAGAINAAFPDVTFGAVSLQLRALAKAGLVSVRPQGRHRYYRVRRERLGPVGPCSADVGRPLWRLKIQAEFDSTRRGPVSPPPGTK
jgi:DNA-binding transcriptional ArsR family regulator